MTGLASWAAPAPVTADTDPEVITAMAADLSGCPWCAMPAAGQPVSHPAECRCQVRCSGIAWCAAAATTSQEKTSA